MACLGRKGEFRVDMFVIIFEEEYRFSRRRKNEFLRRRVVVSLAVH
jgi:hypothetical protein